MASTGKQKVSFDKVSNSKNQECKTVGQGFESPLAAQAAGSSVGRAIVQKNRNLNKNSNSKFYHRNYHLGFMV